MKNKLTAMIALTLFISVPGVVSALTVEPELAKIRYYYNSELHWRSTTWFIPITGTNKTNVCNGNEYDVHTVQIRVNTGTTTPTNESCWYYDHDTSPTNWKQVNDDQKCRNYEDNGLKKTWWTETEDLVDGDGDFLWDYYFDYYMAYGYYESNTWNYLWYTTVMLRSCIG